MCAAEAGELAKESHASATYQQGINDFYQSQGENQNKKQDTIHEYLLYIMSPFIYEEDMGEFCTDLLRFAMDHNYRPEVEWKRYKTKLSCFDVRHLVGALQRGWDWVKARFTATMIAPVISNAVLLHCA